VVERIGHGDLAARMAPDFRRHIAVPGGRYQRHGRAVGMTHEELHARVEEATHDLLLEKGGRGTRNHCQVALSCSGKSRPEATAARARALRFPPRPVGCGKGEPKLVSHIQSAVDSLQNLLDGILDISRLDEGKVIPQPAAFPLAPCSTACHAIFPCWRNKGGLQIRVRPTRIRVHSDEKDQSSASCLTLSAMLCATPAPAAYWWPAAAGGEWQGSRFGTPARGFRTTPAKRCSRNTCNWEIRNATRPRAWGSVWPFAGA
jgi:hypothetical protein